MNFLNLFSKHYFVKCPDGTEVFVYKNCKHALPLVEKDLEVNLSAKLNFKLTQLPEVLSVYKNRTNELLLNLDNSNKSLILGFCIEYATYQTNPCKFNDRLATKIDEIRSQHRFLVEMSLKLNAFVELAKNPKANSKQIATEIKKLENCVYSPDNLEIENALKQSKEAVKQMSKK